MRAGGWEDDEEEAAQPWSTHLRAAEWSTGLGAWCGLRLGGMEDGRRSGLRLREGLRGQSWYAFELEAEDVGGCLPKNRAPEAIGHRGELGLEHREVDSRGRSSEGDPERREG